MAEAVVRLGLDPAGMVAGAQVASASIRSVGNAATRVGQVSARAGERIGQVGGRAGQKFGRDMAAGVRMSAPQFNRAIDQAAKRAQQRLSSIRPTPIRMPAVQQAGVPRVAGMPAPPPGTFVSPEGRLRDSRGRYIVGGARARRPGAGAGAGFGRSDDRGMDTGGMSRLWSMSALGSQLRGVVDQAIQISDQNIEVASGRQIARAEMRTVVDDAGERGTVRAAAREAALGRGGMVVAIDESNFTAAVFRGVASGLQTERAVNLVPVSADLALAGQTTPEEAQIGLTDTGSVFKDRSFRDLGDVYARGQDIGTFRNIGELFSAVTKMASTANAAGMSFEETVAVATTLSRQGPTFRGSTGGQKGMMAVREMELGAMTKLGMTTMRDASGGLDFEGNIRALAAADPSVAAVNEAFGKRAAPAILALIGDVNKLQSTLVDLQSSQGVAAENAREHSDIWRSTLQENQAAIDVFAADVGEGAMRVREAGIVTKGSLARLFAGIPGAGQAAGAALEVGGRLGQLGGAALDTAVGIHAFKQLAHGTLNPMNLFRSESTVDQRRTARGQRGLTRGIDTQARRWRGLFGTMARGVGTSRRGFAGLFAGILRGGVRLGGMVAAELTAAFATKAATRVVGGAAAGIAGAAGAAGATGGAATVAGTAAGIVGAATATGATLVGGLLAPAAVAVAAPIALAKRKAEAEQETRVQAAQAGLGPAETEEAVAEARAGQRALARFQTAREEGKGLLGAMFSGLGFGKTLGEGLAADSETLGAATDEALQPVAQRLPQSDAEIGPLSDLTARGMAIPATLAAGVAEGSPVLQAAITEMLANVGLPAITAPGMLVPAAPEIPAVTAPDLLAPAVPETPDLLAPLAPAVSAIPDLLAPAVPEIAALAPPDPLAPLAVPDVPALAPPTVLAPAVPETPALAAPDLATPAVVTIPDPLVPAAPEIPAVTPPVLLAPTAPAIEAPQVLEPAALAPPDLLAPAVPDVPALAAPDLVAPAVPIIPPLVPPAPVTAALTAPDSLTAPDLLAPDAPVVPPLAPPSPVTAALTAPDALTLDAPLLLPPAAPTVPPLTAPDAPVVPPLLAPAPVTPTLIPPAPVTGVLTAPDALTLDPLAAPGIDPLAAPAVPPLVPPDALALDPLTAPDFTAPNMPALTPPVVVPSFVLPDAPAGPDVPPGAPAAVTGALTGENQATIDGPTIELEAALRAGIAVQQQLARVTMQAVEEMRRERRRHDRPGGAAEEPQQPPDVLDYDIAADLLRERI